MFQLRSINLSSTSGGFRREFTVSGWLPSNEFLGQMHFSLPDSRDFVCNCTLWILFLKFGEMHHSLGSLKTHRLVVLTKRHCLILMSVCSAKVLPRKNRLKLIKFSMFGLITFLQTSPSTEITQTWRCCYCLHITRHFDLGTKMWRHFKLIWVLDLTSWLRSCFISDEGKCFGPSWFSLSHFMLLNCDNDIYTTTTAMYTNMYLLTNCHSFLQQSGNHP